MSQMNLPAESPSIDRIDPVRTHAVTAAQLGVWFSEHAQGVVPAHCRALGLVKAIDESQVRAALDRWADRHPTLRRAFRETDGVLTQRVLDHPLVACERVDASTLPAEECERLLSSESARFLNMPFDLATGQTVRASLIERSDDRLLWLAIHPIVADEHSADRLARDLRALLIGGLGKSPAPSCVDADDAHYRMLVDSQNRQSRHPMVVRQRQWWAEQLRDLPMLKLPTDRPASPADAGEGALACLTLPPALVDGLRDIAHQVDAPLFAVLLAGWQACLMRLSGSRDFGVGIPVTGRRRIDAGDTAGCFGYPMVIRASLDGAQGFRQLVRSVRDRLAEALTRQDVPFDQVVGAVAPRRITGSPPLCQVGFSLRPAQNPDQDPDQDTSIARVWSEPARVGHALLPLALTCRIAGRATLAEFSYRTALFDAETLHRFAGCFVYLLHGLVREPDRAVSQVPMLDSAQRAHLDAWGDASAGLPAWPGPDTLDAAIDAALRSRGEAIAIRHGARASSAATLAGGARDLAHRLIDHHVTRGAVVAVCLPPSPEWVGAQLAVLLTGASVLVLDPALPPEHRACVARLAGSRCVITDATRRGDFATEVARDVARDVDLIVLDQPQALVPARAPGAPACGATPGAMAFLRLISDAQGQPRLVARTHRSLLAEIGWMIGELTLSPADRVLAACDPGGDGSIREVFGALLAGACLVLPDASEDSPDARHPTARPGASAEAAGGAWRVRLDTLTRHACTIAQFTPEGIEALLARPAFPARTALRHALCIGAPLPRSLARRWLARASAVHLTRLFSRVAADGAISAATLDPAEVSAPATAIRMIGRPIAQRRCRVLDTQGQAVPIGVPGLLHVDASTSSARGRVGIPAREREGGDGWLPTGDRARWRADGALEFLGRVDRARDRGEHLVEPARIEAVLLDCPRVEQCVVRLGAESGGGITAYVAGQSVDPHLLREAIESGLPPALRPTVIVRLNQLPLRADGQLDRRRLPAFETPLTTRGHASPHSPAIELLARIWRELLDRDRIDDQDDFFELGGHSLLIPRLAARVQQVFARPLPYRIVLRHPRLADLAAWIGGAQTELPALTHARELREHAPLTATQRGMWMLDQLSDRRESWNLVRTVHLYGALDVALLTHCLNELKMRHAALRTSIQLRGDQPVQVIHANLPFSVPVAAIAAGHASARERELRRVIDDAARAPFDLARAPLLRARLLRLAPDEHLLLWIAHRAMFDDWSIRVLARELDTLYSTLDAARRDGESRFDPLPAEPPQPADHACWQRALPQHPVYGAQLDWWREQLRDAPRLRLPGDRERPLRPERERGALAFELPSAQIDALREVCEMHDATLSMAMLTLFQIALARWSGQRDFTVGMPVGGRQRAELRGLVGNCTDLLVIRADLQGAPDFTQALAHTRRRMLDAYAHSAVPFEHLLSALRLPRDRGANPLAAVCFAYAEPHRQGPAIAGLHSVDAPLRESCEPADLALSMQCRGDAMKAVIEYDADQFDASTVARWQADFAELCAHAATDPQGVQADPPHRAPASRPANGLPAPADVTANAPAAPPNDSADTTPRVAGAAGVSPTERRLTRIWRTLLPVEAASSGDDFFLCGGDSMAMVRLQAEIERQFGRWLPLRRLLRASTLAAQARLLDDPDAALADCGRLVTVRGGDARPGLFLVPDPDDTPQGVSRLSRELDSERSLYLLQARESGMVSGTEPPISALADKLLAQMRHAQPRGPYRLLGLGHGGLLAYEIAQRLRAAGDTVSLLAMIDCQRPAPMARPDLRARLRDRLRQALGGRRTDDMRSRMRMPPSWRSYDPVTYPGRLTLVRATRSDHEPRDSATDDPSMGWSSLAAAGVDRLALDCPSGSMLEFGYVAACAALIERLLGDGLRVGVAAPEPARAMPLEPAGARTARPPALLPRTTPRHARIEDEVEAEN